MTRRYETSRRGYGNLQRMRLSGPTTRRAERTYEQKSRNYENRSWPPHRTYDLKSKDYEQWSCRPRKVDEVERQNMKGKFDE